MVEGIRPDAVYQQVWEEVVAMTAGIRGLMLAVNGWSECVGVLPSQQVC